ncbi:hypothetical protein [Nonomuraea typhae]|uniref:hypothetical protein n=1 Tax=Nonomuraea typhae TaxID=2603600 RepID=UPI0012FB8290|nr:hypothetical protein [Nonomuraea typhae]
MFYGKGPSSYKGLQVPDGGCYGQARREVMIFESPSDDELIRRIEGQAYNLASQSPAVIQAAQKWVSCMAQKGYSYRSPEDAWEDPRWRTRPNDGPSKEEIATALTDMSCKDSTNYIATWYEAESEQQRALISKHTNDLATFRETLNRRLANAAKINDN